MRKFSLVLLIGLLVFTLTGCSQLNTRTSFRFNEGGMMDIEITLRADKTMAENQARTFIWGLLNSVPELQNNYTLTQETKTIDYSDYLYYTFQTKERVDPANHEYITLNRNSEGSYRFQLDIPTLLSEVSEGEKDTRAFTISVTLPKKIEMSNSRDVDGNKATWTIYYHELTDETSLKAMTAS